MRRIDANTARLIMPEKFISGDYYFLVIFWKVSLNYFGLFLA
jgi:hypothetical protein